jgi:GAF domain-containing protein
MEHRVGEAVVIGLVRDAASAVTREDLAGALHAICASASRRLGYRHVAVFLTEGGRLRLRATEVPDHVPRVEIPVDPSPFQQAIRNGTPTLVDGPTLQVTHPFFAAARSGACAPVRIGQRTVGILVSLCPEPGTLTARDLEVMGIVAALAAQAVERARLEELAEASTDLHAATDLKEFALRAAARAARLAGADFAVVCLDGPGSRPRRVSTEVSSPTPGGGRSRAPCRPS